MFKNCSHLKIQRKKFIKFFKKFNIDCFKSLTGQMRFFYNSIQKIINNSENEHIEMPLHLTPKKLMI